MAWERGQANTHHMRAQSRSTSCRVLRLDSVLRVKGGLAGSKAVGGMRGGEEGEGGRWEQKKRGKEEGGGGGGGGG